MWSIFPQVCLTAAALFINFANVFTPPNHFFSCKFRRASQGTLGENTVGADPEKIILMETYGNVRIDIVLSEVIIDLSSHFSTAFRKKQLPSHVDIAYVLSCVDRSLCVSSQAAEKCYLWLLTLAHNPPNLSRGAFLKSRPL